MNVSSPYVLSAEASMKVVSFLGGLCLGYYIGIILYRRSSKNDPQDCRVDDVNQVAVSFLKYFIYGIFPVNKFSLKHLMSAKAACHADFVNKNFISALNNRIDCSRVKKRKCPTRQSLPWESQSPQKFSMDMK